MQNVLERDNLESSVVWDSWCESEYIVESSDSPTWQNWECRVISKGSPSTGQIL